MSIDKDRLYKHIRAKYAAADGGEIPDDAPEEEAPAPEEEAPAPEEEAPAPEEEAPAPEEEAPEEQMASAASTPLSPSDQVKAALMSKYDTAAASNAQNIADAHDRRDSLDLVSNLGRALEGAVRSNSMAHGGAGVNNSVYDSIQNHGERGVKDAQDMRQASINNFLQKSQLEDQLVKRQLEQGTLDQHNQALAYSRAANTPGSLISLSKIQQFNKLFPTYAIDEKTGTAAQVDSTLKSVTAKARIDGVAEQGKLRAQMASDSAAARNQAMADRADATAKRQGELAYTKASALADGGRGSSVAVMQALKDTTSVQKINKAFSAYPDLNKMPSAQVNNVIDEIQKLATGGQGTESGRKGQDPGTLASAWAHFQQKVGNKPTGAELGAFLAENKTLVDGYGEQAGNILAEHRKSVYNGARGSFTPDQDQRWRETHYRDFADQPAAAVASQPQQSVVMTSPDGKQYSVPAEKVAVAKAKGWK